MRALRVVAVCAVGFSSAGANAHVVMKDFEARAGYQEVLTLIVPHGCGLSATTELRVKIPDGLPVVVPQPQAGWETNMTMRKLEKPVPFEGGRMITEVPDEITWKGNLPSSQLGLFNILARMPDKAGTRLYFKTIQKCADGETKWIETISDNEEMWRVWLKPSPAPFVVTRDAGKPQLGVDMETLRKAQVQGKDGSKAKPQ